MPKKNNQHQRNYLLTSKQQNTVSTSSHSIWRTTNKNGKKNLKLVFHLSVSHTTIHVVKLIPCLTSSPKMINTQNGDSHAIRRQTIQTWRNMRHVTPFCPHKTKAKKFLNDTRETSPLTALLFSQFVLSSCLRTAHSERLCC